MSINQQASPRLDALLSSLRQRLVRQVWLHGLGTTVAVLSAWYLFAFTADYLLHVPLGVRVFHGLLFVVLPLYVLQRELWLPLSKLPDRAGLALLIERAHPDLHELFVSAVQLREEGPAARGAQHIQRIVELAEEHAARIDLTSVLEPRGPRRRMGAGLASASIALAVTLAFPALTGIFVERMFSSQARWPQKTYLSIEVPLVASAGQVATGAEVISVRVARGSDVPVIVRAEGVVPSEVRLHFASGQDVVLSSGGTALFRTLLRSVQEDVEFYVTGGDDVRGKPVVELTVLQPPDITGLAVQITPPAYSGLPPRTEYDGDVDALAGSTIQVAILPDPPSATGIARVLPEDRAFELEPTAFVKADGSTSPALGFELIADASLRYRFELTDASGLPNPDPALFGIQVVEDRRPEVFLLSPGRSDMSVVAGGALPLRVRIEDDFGLASVRWELRSAQDVEHVLTSGELETSAIDLGPYESRPGPSVAARQRLEVDALNGPEPVLEGQMWVLSVIAQDNREPTANESQAAPVRLRVVSGDEYLRNLQDNLARAGEQASRLLQLQEEKHGRTADLIAMTSGDVVAEGPLEVSSLLTGERRVQGDARALARELAGIAEGLLYSRIDERGGPLLDALDTGLGAYTDRSFHAEPWRELAQQYAGGSLGSAGLAGQLVRIVDLALEVSEEHTLQAATAFVDANEATAAGAVREALERAHTHQAAAIRGTEQLIELLAEWDNYQSVLTFVRDLMNRQKNLTERTRQFAKEN